MSFKKVRLSNGYYIPANTIGRVCKPYTMPTIDTSEIVAMEDTHITVRGYRRRTTIPSGIFKFLDLEDGDVIRWIAKKDGTVLVSKLDE
ncbi:hypothetical protein GF326_07250 [Candidatus Bathyarchaeota archaeon]|nr:hypothetical protein [Candidatus Bathyarchaeota archaeon]